MSSSKGGMTVWLLVVGALAAISAYLVSDSSGAHLQLAPVFFGVAVSVATVWLFRSRSGRSRS